MGIILLFKKEPREFTKAVLVVIYVMLPVHILYVLFGGIGDDFERLEQKLNKKYKGKKF